MFVKVAECIKCRHQAAGEKVLAHPISFALNFKGIGYFTVAKNMHEQFARWLEPIR